MSASWFNFNLQWGFVVQLLSRVSLFVTLWTAACQASLPCTITGHLFKFTSIESVKPSNHLILCHPLLLLAQSFPASGSFPMSWLFASAGQGIGASALAPVLPVNIQGWFSLGLTDLTSLQSKEFSRVFSSTTVWKHQFFSVQPSLWSDSHICTTTRKTITSTTRIFVSKVMSLLFNILSLSQLSF